MRIGDVYFVKFRFEEDDTLYKSRPAVIALCDAENESNSFVALKITTKERRYDVNTVRIMDRESAGLDKVSYVRCDKVEILNKNDIISDLGTNGKLGSLSYRDLVSIREKIENNLKDCEYICKALRYAESRAKYEEAHYKEYNSKDYEDTEEYQEV